MFSSVHSESYSHIDPKICISDKMEKKKGKVDNAEDEKEEEGKKEDESDPTPSVGLFELVTLNLRYTS